MRCVAVTSSTPHPPALGRHCGGDTWRADQADPACRRQESRPWPSVAEGRLREQESESRRIRVRHQGRGSESERDPVVESEEGGGQRARLRQVMARDRRSQLLRRRPAAVQVSLLHACPDGAARSEPRDGAAEAKAPAPAAAAPSAPHPAAAPLRSGISEPPPPEGAQQAPTGCQGGSGSKRRHHRLGSVKRHLHRGWLDHRRCPGRLCLATGLKSSHMPNARLGWSVALIQLLQPIGAHRRPSAHAAVSHHRNTQRRCWEEAACCVQSWCCMIAC